LAAILGKHEGKGKQTIVNNSTLYILGLIF